MNVPVKWHKNFVARRGEMLTQIAADFGGVTVSFPRNGSSSEVVKLSGAKDCVAGAKMRILEIVDDLVGIVYRYLCSLYSTVSHVFCYIVGSILSLQTALFLRWIKVK